MADLHYERIAISDNNDPLVDAAGYPFAVEPAYYKQGLADIRQIYLRQEIAEKLGRLQENELKGYQFKLWDGWRSRAVQANIYNKFLRELGAINPDWEHEKLQREVRVYVSAPDTPGRIPPHSTGGAIDLTLIDRKTGMELDMGTGFDHFGIEASPNYFEHTGSNITARDNRRMLFEAMHREGFTIDPDEWWHFDYGNQKWAEAAGKPTAIYGEVFRINDRFSYLNHAATKSEAKLD